jgi:hypothetical protein
MTTTAVTVEVTIQARTEAELYDACESLGDGAHIERYGPGFRVTCYTVPSTAARMLDHFAVVQDSRAATEEA